MHSEEVTAVVISLRVLETINCRVFKNSLLSALEMSDLLNGHAEAEKIPVRQCCNNIYAQQLILIADSVARNE